MDIVIPFVDCSKKKWTRDLLDQEYFSLPIYIKPKDVIQYGYGHKLDYTYYYDYGTLKYVLRGIDKFIPDVQNIFLLVSDLEQIPDYINQEKIKVVLHKDFIPSEFLPVFSSNIIDSFINRIPGLDEEFIYMHDDMIPISPISYDELFKDGEPCLKFNTHNDKLSPYNKNIYKLSYYTAVNTLHTSNRIILYPEHGPVSLLKSLYDKFSTYILPTNNKHPYRSSYKINISYLCDLIYLSNECVKSDISTSNISISELNDFNLSSLSEEYRYLCINNMKSDTLTISEVKEVVNNKLDTLLPNKCIYERN